MKTIESMLEEIYALERNVQISCFWDGGWEAKIGDPTNGWKDDGLFKTVRQAVEWLYETIVTTRPV